MSDMVIICSQQLQNSTYETRNTLIIELLMWTLLLRFYLEYLITFN